jgi:hypothetical protein
MHANFIEQSDDEMPNFVAAPLPGVKEMQNG